MMVNSNLGTNVRAHLLNTGIEKVNNLKYYNLNDNSRIRIMAKHIKDLNLVMGIELSDENSMKIASKIYKQNAGLSYKNFPNIQLPDRSDIDETSPYDYIMNTKVEVTVIPEDDWQEVKKHFRMQLKIHGYLEGAIYDDIQKIFEFYAKRPYNPQNYVALVEEASKYLYSTSQAKVIIVDE